MTTGAKPQRMEVPGEERLTGYGLSYSVVTHGALFLGKDVAVVGTYRRAQLAALAAELEAANRELELKVRQLDEAYNFQRSILQSIPTAVVVTDLSGRIKAFNPAAERLSGWAGEDLLGKPLSVWLPDGTPVREMVLRGWGEPLLHPRLLPFAAAAQVLFEALA